MLTRRKAIATVLQLQQQLASAEGYETRKAIRERVARLAKEVHDLKSLNESFRGQIHELNMRNETLMHEAQRAQQELEEIISGPTTKQE